MKDEIKEILELHLYREDYNKLLDYITNLQDRIDKSIEYLTSYDSINELMRYETSKDNNGLDRKTMIEMDRRYAIIHHNLLNILQNDEELKGE